VGSRIEYYRPKGIPAQYRVTITLFMEPRRYGIAVNYFDKETKWPELVDPKTETSERPFMPFIIHPEGRIDIYVNDLENRGYTQRNVYFVKEEEIVLDMDSSDMIFEFIHIDLIDLEKK
jgi:hypothetical protein